MSWWNSADWITVPVNPDVKNMLAELCSAVNEREIYIGKTTKSVSSLTRSGTTATATTTTDHLLETGDFVYISGAEDDYNGLHQITKTGAATYTFTVAGAAPTPATGTITSRQAATKFLYDADGHTKYFPTTTDFEGLRLSAESVGQKRNLYLTWTPVGISNAGTLATVTISASFVARLAVGDTVEISGANESPYNGTFTVFAIPTSNTFQYIMTGGIPPHAATGTLRVTLYEFVKRAGTTATVRLPGHGFHVGSVVKIQGADQSEYNGSFRVTRAVTDLPIWNITRAGTTATVLCQHAHGLRAGDLVTVQNCTQTQYNGVQTVVTTPTATSFTYIVSGSPASPATGVPFVLDISTFDFEISGSPDSPATGQMTAEANRVMVGYVTVSGLTATFYAPNCGFEAFTFIASGATFAGGKVTITATADNVQRLRTGDTVVVTGASPSAYNGTFIVTDIPDSTSFQYEITTSPSSPASGTIQIQRSATPRFVEVVCTDSSVPQFNRYGQVASVGANGFTFALDSAPSSLLLPWSPSASGVIYAFIEGDLRYLIRQIRTAIEGLLTTSTANGAIRFVADSAPYATNLTLSAVLSAGSYGSSWLPLNQLQRTDLSYVLDQMREALSELTVLTVQNIAALTGTNYLKSTNQLSSYSGGISYVNMGSYYLQSLTFDVGQNHQFQVGDRAFIESYIGSGPSFNVIGFANITDVSGQTIKWHTTASPVSTTTGGLVYNVASRQNAWDDAVSVPRNVTNTLYLGGRFISRSMIGTPTEWIYAVQEVATAVARFKLIDLPGTFKAGKVGLTQSNNSTDTQDTFVVTDSDGDTINVDAALGTSTAAVTVTKPDAWFAGGNKDITYTTPEPATQPFGTATASRRCLQIGSAAVVLTRQLVAGTDLTYG